MKILSLLILGVALAGCGTIIPEPAPKQTMLTSSQNVAGSGTVQAKADSSGNTDVSVRVKHLAAPQKLAQDSSVYVVWIEPRNAQPQNVGVLSIDSDLDGSLDTKTPHKSFKLFITPESSQSVTAPMHKPVFTADVIRAE